MRKTAAANLFLTFILLITAYLKGSSQSSFTASAIQPVSGDSALSTYHRILYPETNLYNGSEYAYNVYYPFVINEGHPFFASKDFYNSDIVCNGIWYKNVPMLFDIIHEEVLVQSPGKLYIIKLHNENIQSFSLWGHTFVRIIKDNSESLIHTGFYDVLYNGKTSLYKKPVKQLKENSASAQGLNKYVSETDLYFIKKDNHYQEIKNKKTLLTALIDKKKEIIQFIKNNHLNIKKQKDESFTSIVAYYNTLHT